MAIRSGFFNSVNGDRKYGADFFADYFASFIGNGVFPNPSNNLQIMANNDMTVTVEKGRAWINGYILVNESDHVINLDPADGVLNRIDRVVLKLDTRIDREINIVVKKGEYNNTPTAPLLQRDADGFELALADVYIAGGNITITQADISDTRLNNELCGVVSGVVEQVDVTTLFNQYQSWYTQTTTQATADIETIKTQFTTQFDDWFNLNTTEWGTDFDIWFNGIKGRLQGDIATQLALQITDLENNKADKVYVDNEIAAIPIPTKQLIGLGNVDNVKQASKAEFNLHNEDITSEDGRHGIRYWQDKLEIKINGVWEEHKSSEGFKVGNVANLAVDEDDRLVKITLEDPPDTTITDSNNNQIVISEWGGTILRRKLLSYPIDENDGDLVFDNKIRDRYKGPGFTDSGLINDRQYFYMAFPYTKDGVYTVDSANRITATPTEIDPNSWRGIQKIVRKGLTNDFFSVGDQLLSNYGSGQITWEVIGIDVDTPEDTGLTHSMTLQTKDCLHNVQFDAPEPSNSNTDRRSYGNNRYIHSAIKQWLNSSEATFNWQSQHGQDAKPTDNLDIYNGPGFLNKLDPELAAVIGAANKNVARNTVTDSGGQDVFSDKVFLLSQKEVGLGTEGDTTGEIVYPYYDGVANASRIKQLSGSPRVWWLRSPYVGLSSNVRSVNAGGSLYHNIARSAYGVAPACVII